MIVAFTGVLALGLILVPGFSYRIGRESGWESGLAAKRPLGFRETALLIVPGFLATFTGLCVFAVIRAVSPSHTPDVGRIADDPGQYMSDHLSYVFWWCAVVLGIASVLAFLGGLTVTRWLVKRGRTQHSSWHDWLEHPVARRALVHTQIAGHMGRRPAGLCDYPNSPITKLPIEISSWSGHSSSL